VRINPYSDPFRPQRRAVAAMAALIFWAAAGFALPEAVARPSGYPAKPVRILLGYPPGGTADVMARLVAEHLRVALGQNVIIENKPGAHGNLGAQELARSVPDGHTLLFGNTGEIASNRYMMKDVGFDPDADLAPIALVYNITHAILVSARSPHRNLAELIEYARSRPGKVTYASVGLGSPGHVAGEMISLRTGAPMLHVPYKGTAQAMPDVIGGHVDAFITGLIVAAPQLSSGTVRMLATTGPRRTSVAPDVPTVAEVAIPGFDFPLWGGLFAPSKTPRDVVVFLNAEVNKVFDLPDFQARAAALYSDIIRSTPEQFAAFVRSESEKYREIAASIAR
jgi:tripartite-type tricarboxylate transporter receptor subunit TctC